jgi:NAD(P)-dependent dehydrogenase (short-subunit alcohol dehydrogenase family)
MTIDAVKERAPFSCAGRVALVTGGGRGVGQGIALALSRAGAAVIVNDLHRGRAEAVAAEIVASGGRGVGVAGDVRDLASVRAFVAEGVAKLGPVDILVNNAGIPETFIPEPFRASEPEHWETFLRLNLYGVLHCAKAVLDGMCDRGWGRIVTISSEAWRVGSAIGISMYAAGKAGAIGFSRQLACEVGECGVTVNCVALGEMDNLPMADQLAKRYPTKRVGTPGDVAGAVLYLVSEEASWVTGQVLAVNGGLVTA